MTPRRVTTVAGMREVTEGARVAGRSVGFVPTMGSLHEGHVSLLEAARARDDLVVLSVFVNPLQFGEGEDLDAYPRDLGRDTELAAAAGTDVVFAPSREEMYPEPVLTTVTVEGVSAGYEGGSRPTHFAGVATVVAKLLAVVGECRAYFGEKDFQQLAVVRRMMADLSFPVEVVGCPTVREPDGLAMSSRNIYLSPAERAAAPVLHRALSAGADAVLAGCTDPAEVRSVMARVLDAEPLAERDYVAVVEPRSFAVPDPLRGALRLLGAVRFGRARLIDNLGVTAPGGMHHEEEPPPCAGA